MDWSRIFLILIPLNMCQKTTKVMRSTKLFVFQPKARKKTTIAMPPWLLICLKLTQSGLNMALRAVGAPSATLRRVRSRNPKLPFRLWKVSRIALAKSLFRLLSRLLLKKRKSLVETVAAPFLFANWPRSLMSQCLIVLGTPMAVECMDCSWDNFSSKINSTRTRKRAEKPIYLLTTS